MKILTFALAVLWIVQVICSLISNRQALALIGVTGSLFCLWIGFNLK